MRHIFSQNISILLVVVLATVLLALVKFAKPSKAHTYTKQKYLLTKAELQFFDVLQKALENTRLCAIPKVRLGDLIAVSGTKDKEWFRMYAKVAQKHVDFALCKKDTMQIVGAIELDDRSHRKEDNSRRDAEKNHCCKKAGITLIRVQAAKEYSKNHIYSTIRQCGIL